ncbi:TonB-dependent receptor plug domain-containing protein [Nibricoccus sp. IMCC34717]|uniref:TonB-dependent receptor plug domain-containing protein n=1 Tax=Nibricoccus sp. IMCC34717 TaxID=3034021 RepID=UPI003851700D
MSRNRTHRFGRSLGLSALLASGSAFAAPEAPVPAPAAVPEDEVIELSPFEVEATPDDSYSAKTTLAGTRVRTDLGDMAQSFTVVTSQFLQDTGARNNQDLLVYTTNTEVGGLYGNYAGVGNGANLNETSKLLKPNENTRVRGLTAADNTRDYFTTDIPWDAYNVDRVEIQRGPNSILFGVGSPAGIINTATVVTNLRKSNGKAEVRFGSFGSFRMQADYNQVIQKNKLAVRILAVDDDTQYRQQPAYNHGKRVFGVAEWKPQLLPAAWASPLNVKVNGEFGQERSNNPRILPPIDYISLFFNPAGKQGLNGQIYDPRYSHLMGFQYHTAGRGANNEPKYLPKWVPALSTFPVGFGSSAGMIGYYNNGSGAPLDTSILAGSQYFGIGPNGAIDKSLDIKYGKPLFVAGLLDYSLVMNAKDPNLFPGAQKLYYKDQTLRDRSVFDYVNNLIDGPNKREWKDWDSRNLSISQSFFSNRLGFEYVYDAQHIKQGITGLSVNWEAPYISVDVNKYLYKDAPTYTGTVEEAWGTDTDYNSAVGGTLNPNAGRAFVGGLDSGGSYSQDIRRTNNRLTGFGELRADDFLQKDSFLARLLGRHQITGLYQNDKRETEELTWKAFAISTDWVKMQGGSNLSINNEERSIKPIVYISPSLIGQSGTNLHLSPLTALINPKGAIEATYFDSHWNKPTDPNAAGYVNPADKTYRDPVDPRDSALKEQSENPANYVGYRRGTMNVLNYDNPADRDQLYTSAYKTLRQVKSRALVWQGHLLDDVIVPTIGFRRDQMRIRGTAGPLDNDTYVASRNFTNANLGKDDVIETSTRTWGVVAKLPKSWAKNLPLQSNISAFYSDANNANPVIRYGFNVNRLPNPKANSKDYGIAISMLDDKLSFKITRYVTKEQNADLQGVVFNSSQLERALDLSVLAAHHAYINKLGINGQLDAKGDQPPPWHWNWAWWDDTLAGTNATDYSPNVNAPAFLNHPATVAEKEIIDATIANLETKEWYAAYGYDLDPAKLRSSDWDTFRSAVRGGNFSTQGGGYVPSSTQWRINGQTPNGTIDQESRGYEFEMSAQPIEGWRITANAAKTDAKRTQLGTDVTTFIQRLKARFDGRAGDMRLWWAGGEPIRKTFYQAVYAPYEFQIESNGQSAPEIRPWTFNLVNNYTFKDGLFKGSWAGFAFRHQQAAILGYRLGADLTNPKLDATKPIRGGAETAIDFWVGHSRKLTDRINWRIQLNLRNVGDKVHLVPISVNPDGTVAAQRIAEGMTWSLSNTFEF